MLAEVDFTVLKKIVKITTHFITANVFRYDKIFNVKKNQ